MRHVGVPDLDQRFTDFAETFNHQQEHYECMQEKRRALLYRYRCAPDSSLSECLQKIQDEHGESEQGDAEPPAGGSGRSDLGDLIYFKQSVVSTSVSFTSCLMYLMAGGKKCMQDQGSSQAKTKRGEYLCTQLRF